MWTFNTRQQVSWQPVDRPMAAQASERDSTNVRNLRVQGSMEWRQWMGRERGVTTVLASLKATARGVKKSLVKAIQKSLTGVKLAADTNTVLIHCKLAVGLGRITPNTCFLSQSYLSLLPLCPLFVCLSHAWPLSYCPFQAPFPHAH